MSDLRLRLRRCLLAGVVVLTASGCGVRGVEISSMPRSEPARDNQSGAPQAGGLGAAPIADPAPLAAPPADVDGRRAVIIGIDSARRARKLEGAVRDAQTLQQALVSYGFPSVHITTLTDEAATREAILTAISRLAAEAPEGGRVVFSFAGHTRRIGGQNHLVAADGRTIPAQVLAEALGAVRAPMWVALPTCYAAGFSIPGITGPGRVATFASAADEQAYEASWYGRSFLFQYLVAEGMLAGRASGSVEQAFAYAQAAIQEQYPDRVPLMDDQFPGEFTLGPPLPYDPHFLAASSTSTTRAPKRQHAETVKVDEPSATPPPPERSDRRPSGGPAQICSPTLRMGRCTPPGD